MDQISQDGPEGVKATADGTEMTLGNLALGTPRSRLFGGHRERHKPLLVISGSGQDTEDFQQDRGGEVLREKQWTSRPGAVLASAGRGAKPTAASPATQTGA